MKIAIPSVAFNREQLDAFQRLFEAFSLLSKPMKSKSLLKIYDRKNIELISGKLGGDRSAKQITPTFSFNVYISGGYIGCCFAKVLM